MLGTMERGVQFFLGFLLGKCIGAIVSTYPLLGMYLEDSNLSGLVFEEFISYLLGFNAYHYVLAIIGGLILVVWKSDDLFD